jgi:hypothetical protein
MNLTHRYSDIIRSINLNQSVKPCPLSLTAMTDQIKTVPSLDESQYESSISSTTVSQDRRRSSNGETYDEFEDDYNIIFVSNFVPPTPGTLSRVSTRMHPVRQVTDIDIVTTKGLTREATQSICQRVSPLHEVLFVAILSSAQLITRKSQSQCQHKANIHRGNRQPGNRPGPNTCKALQCHRCWIPRLGSCWLLSHRW